MFRHTFVDGHKHTSKLDIRECIKRMNRLDTLRVLTEGFEDGCGASICSKAIKAYNKEDNFTGIIRLTFLEKDFLGYVLASHEDSLREAIERGYDKGLIDSMKEDVEVLKYYVR